MTGHVHAQSMLLYAQDAMETDQPWERWQVDTFKEGIWLNLDRGPHWDGQHNYRRRPKIIMINGHKVDEPLPQVPLGVVIYYPDIGSVAQYRAIKAAYHGDNYVNMLLRHGLLHTTREAAISHAKALLSFTQKEPS